MTYCSTAVGWFLTSEDCLLSGHGVGGAGSSYSSVHPHVEVSATLLLTVSGTVQILLSFPTPVKVPETVVFI